ncbi:monovalent cation:proton antiporter-2 (CPA2) family protein [Pseudomonas sp. GX19020]|uniref:monovalent cation:proton antiporter-2 (CPA2) family protein n=1 Tax=Pseudomonas sp. GX19020 TaxID=2942277 RepID=UPI00201962F7|nr:monovalent cation:proton antiporter-2 (CPA2) family protein [Pseudomonas sp. GX19020]MCL4067033.1 monovalent cation:proton antiporter-2 (CPA2) family protein [Pseudomonas sp. GX19020]
MAEQGAGAAEVAALHGGGVDLTTIVILLAAAVIAVPLFRRLGLGSVLGFLAAGLLIGPFGLKVIEDAEAVIHVAELGVVLFLFVIGLEMQPSRLWSMRGEIFGLGLIQVVGAIAVLTCVGLALGYPASASFVAGTGFVLTSTAVVMQMLSERRQMETPAGRRIISILLLEDLAIVPLLAIVAFIAPGAEEATMMDRVQDIGAGLGCIVVLVVAGRYLLDPMFGFLARFGGRDVMTAAALLVVLAAALLMQAGGLSMAMGAFLAGVLLSESSYRHQLETDVEPFRGLLLGLFFMGVGMALNLTVIRENAALIAFCVPVYIILKMLVIYSVARLLKTPRAEARERAVVMAQGGEFAFVLYATATQVGVLTAEWNATLTAIVICSMALTPLMMILFDRFSPKAEVSLEGVEEASGLNANILLIGFGRFGQMVSQPLLKRGYTVSIIDSDAQVIRDAADFGFRVWYGDGTRLDILRNAGAAEASLIVAATDDPEATLKIVGLVKHEFPLVPVFARAWDREHAVALMKADADFQIRETRDSALALGHAALVRLGDTPEEADDLMQDVRANDVQRLAIDFTEGLAAGAGLIQGNKDAPSHH